ISSFTLQVYVGARKPPSGAKTASVSTPGDTNARNDMASNLTTVNPAPAPDLWLVMGRFGDFTVGTFGDYQLTVTNVGNGATTGTITVIDTLPDGLRFVSSSGGIGRAGRTARW